MNRLKFERINRHLSQEKLAWLAQVPEPVISLIETGTWNPTPEHLAAIARVLHIDPELLLQEFVPRFVAACTEEREQR